MDLVEDGGQDHHHLGNAWVVHRVVLVADRARHATGQVLVTLVTMVTMVTMVDTYQAILWLGAPALRPQLG